MWKWYEGWTHADIAKDLGLSRSWVTTLLSNADKDGKKQPKSAETEEREG